MDKRVLILEYIRLGMDLDRAALLAECSMEEQLALESDPTFAREQTLTEVIRERDLLGKLERVIDTNVALGNSTEVRWMLERLNPKKWGASRSIKAKGKQEEGGGFSFAVEFAEGFNGEDSN